MPVVLLQGQLVPGGFPDSGTTPFCLPDRRPPHTVVLATETAWPLSPLQNQEVTLHPQGNLLASSNEDGKVRQLSLEKYCDRSFEFCRGDLTSTFPPGDATHGWNQSTGRANPHIWPHQI